VLSGVITGIEQRTCELFSMPRGSMPTRSNRSMRVGEKTFSATSTTYFAAPSPGPPGLKKRVPTRCCWSLAGRRATASETVAPEGIDQSIGTRSVPHWVCGDFSHVDHSILKRVCCGPGSAEA
jgi:hypothetical protein